MFLPFALRNLVASIVISALPSLSGVDYHPNVDQAAFLSAPEMHSFLISGFGGGKTETLCKRTLLDALQYPGYTHGIGAPTHQMLKRNTWKTLKASVPKALLAQKPTEPPDARMVLINDSIIEGYHLSDPDALDGPNLASFAVDEINNKRIREEAIDRVINRLRGGGARFPSRLYGVGNPRGHNWFWVRYVATAEQLYVEGYTEKDVRLVMQMRQWARVYTTTTYANRAHLGEWYIKQMEATYPEGTRRERALGASFDEASGDVYSDFDPKQHIVAPPADWINGKPPEYLVLLNGIDFGGTHPFAAEGVAVDTRPGRGKCIYYAFAEHYEAGEADVFRHAAKIKKKIIEPMGARRWEHYSEHEPHTRSTLGRTECLGTTPTLAHKATEVLRISEINRLFREDRLFLIGDPVDSSGMLRPRTPGLLANLSQREFDDDGTPEDDNNDATDALEYAISSYNHYGARSTRITQW